MTELYALPNTREEQPDDATNGEPAEPAERTLSALRENVERKGKNSYYYAHSRVIDDHQWDGKEEPRLLHRTVSEQGSVSPERTKAYATITGYAWADEEHKVKIYIPVTNSADAPAEPGGEPLPPTPLAEDAVALQWTRTSLTVDMRSGSGVGSSSGGGSGSGGSGGGSGGGAGAWERLHLELSGDITGAAARRRPGKVVVTLTKADAGAWHDLRKK